MQVTPGLLHHTEASDHGAGIDTQDAHKAPHPLRGADAGTRRHEDTATDASFTASPRLPSSGHQGRHDVFGNVEVGVRFAHVVLVVESRSEEHTSELQS